VSRRGSAGAFSGSEAVGFGTQKHFDDLWDFLTIWHSRDPYSKPEVREQLPADLCDCAPLRKAIQKAEREKSTVSGVIHEVWSEVPDWFRSRLLELEGQLIADWDVSREKFGYLFKTNGKTNRLSARIGKYDLLSKVGAGGMGCVFKGFDPTQGAGIDRLRAIKILPPDSEPRIRDAWQRFMREARIWRGLTHPNIVLLDDFPGPMSEEIPHFAMEYVYGPTLHDLLTFHRERGRTVPLGLALDVIRQIAEGFQYIESKDRSLVHRDLKPQNVLLTRNPKHSLTPCGWLIKIADFGLAKESADMTLTGTGDVVGTADYMAPEQRANQDITPATDVYSLGVIFHELITGFRPRPGEDVRTRKQFVSNRINAEKSQIWRMSAIDRLQKLLSAMLEKEAKIRPPWDVILREIKAIQDSHSVIRKWAIIVGGATLFLLSIVALFGLLYTKYNERDNVNREIDVCLSQSDEFNDEQLIKLRDLLSKKAMYDPDGTNRKWNEFDETIRRSIGKQRLEERDRLRLRRAIELLKSHDSERAVRLTRDLDDRLSNFQLQWQWPDTDPNSIFGPGVVAEESKALVLRPSANSDHIRRVITKTPCGVGGCRLRVEIGESWMNAPELGLELNSDGKNSGYILSLHPVPAIDAPGTGTEVPPTLRAAKEMKQDIELRILHKQVVLRRFRYAASKFPQGSIALTAERNGRILTLTVDGVGTIDFEDVFATSDLKDGAERFAIRWPKGIPLLKLRAEEITQPKSPSPLERGDKLYSQDNLKSYSEALEAYQQAELEDVNRKWRTELQYKKALCKVKLKHDKNEIIGLFQGILDTGDKAWRPAAYMQLWSFYLTQGQQGIKYADDLIAHRDQYLLDRNLAPLVRRVPEADGLNIIEYYRARVSSSHATGLSDDERIRLGRDWVDAEEFLFGDATESKFWLSRAYSRSKSYQDALDILESLPQKDDNLNIVTERIWLMRQLEPSKPGSIAQALDVLHKLESSKHFGNTPTERIVFSVLRAECYAAQNDWDSVLTALNPKILNDDIGVGPDREPIRAWLHREWLPRAWLMRGFARISQDSKADVQHDWKNASRNLYEPTGRSGLLAYLVSRSLAGDSDEKDVKVFLRRVREESSGSGAFIAIDLALNVWSHRSSLMGGPNPEVIMKDVVREMWRTEEGRKLARKYAFRTWGPDEQPSQSKALAGCEFLRQQAFLRSEDPNQWAACWAVAEKGLSYMSTGDAKSDMFSLGSAWFGKTERKGIDALFDKIPAEHRSLRAPAAYVLAHQMLSLKKTEEAKHYLGLARDYTTNPDKPDLHLMATLRALIEKDFNLLNQEKGILVLKSNQPGKVFLSVMKDGKLTRIEELTCNAPLEIKAGDYRLEWEGSADVIFMPSMVHLDVCRRLTIYVTRSK
jgi:serine/threonine protein kinase